MTSLRSAAKVRADASRQVRDRTVETSDAGMVDIYLIVDESGSMEPLRSDTIGASHKFTKAAVKELIEGKVAAGWEIMYFGANVDAFAEAGGIGINAASTHSFAATSVGVAAAYSGTSSSTTAYRKSTTGGTKP